MIFVTVALNNAFLEFLMKTVSVKARTKQPETDIQLKF